MYKVSIGNTLPYRARVVYGPNYFQVEWTYNHDGHRVDTEYVRKFHYKGYAQKLVDELKQIGIMATITG